MNPRLLFLSLTMTLAAQAAELQPVTVRAWDEYVQAADAAMRDRVHDSGVFLWADEAPGRRARLRSGEILVVSAGEHNPKKVPSGLIHHWMGAAFFPNTKIEDVMGVVRDYAHYKDYYNPSVVDSKAIRQSPGEDRFSTLLMNKAFFLKTALENEYESVYVPAGPQRWYNIASAVRVQEIEGYGQANERRLASGEGSGYIWRLHSIVRYEEADGGVYVEVEAMALSREIPVAVRFVVDPIVRRVSRSAVVTSLKQTQEAIESHAQTVARRSGTIPSYASGFVPR